MTATTGSETTHDVFLTPREVASLARISTGTLANWRSRRVGPPFAKLGGAVRYGRQDVAAWVDAQKIEMR